MKITRAHSILTFNSLILFSFTFFAPAFAAKPKAGAVSTAPVSKVLEGLRQAKAIKAKVKKTVTQEVMGTEMKSSGDFFFSKGKLRLDILEPEKSSLVYDGKVVWLESRILDANGEKIQVAKMRPNELKKSDSLLTALFERKDVLKSFKLLAMKTVDGQQVYSFEPKDKKKTEVQYLEIVLKDKELMQIQYRDQVENRVSLEFSELTKADVPANKFVYKPPKNADVTEF